MADSRNDDQGPEFDWRKAPLTRLPFDDEDENAGQNAGVLDDWEQRVPRPQRQPRFEMAQPVGGVGGLGGAPGSGPLSPGPQARDIRAPDDGRPPLPCLEGPCRHWTGIGQVMGVVAGQESVRHYQYCRLHLEDGWTMPMHELTVRFCSSYAPPWWSWAGWRQRMRSAPKQQAMLYGAHATPPPVLRMALWLRETCDEWGWSERFGLLPRCETRKMREG